MLADERRFQIREILAVQRAVTASELCDRLNVTSATIRRDLAYLEQEGVLVRSYGGAVSRMASTNFQLPYDTSLFTHAEEMRQIASAAEQLVRDGETVFLEGSTALFALARHLAHRSRLTVVTNSIGILCELQGNLGLTVLCTGGELQKDGFCLAGEWAQRCLSEIRLDKAILGVTAIDPEYGISTTNYAEAQIKKVAAKAAKIRIGLAHHANFGLQRLAYVGSVSQVDILITDVGTDSKYREELRNKGVQVVIAEACKENSTLLGHATSKLPSSG